MVPPKANPYCSTCEEWIYNGEEYTVNEDNEYRYYDCFSGMSGYWIGLVIKLKLWRKLMKDNKVKHIIPRIHNLRDLWFIQWLGIEYYIAKPKIKNIIVKRSTIYFLLDFLLMISIWIIAGIFPIKTPVDFIKMFLLAAITGIQSGIAIANDYEDKNK